MLLWICSILLGLIILGLIIEEGGGYLLWKYLTKLPPEEVDMTEWELITMNPKR